MLGRNYENVVGEWKCPNCKATIQRIQIRRGRIKAVKERGKPTRFVRVPGKYKQRVKPLVLLNSKKYGKITKIGDAKIVVYPKKKKVIRKRDFWEKFWDI